MIVVPTYNMILSPEATLFFPFDQLRRSAGSGGVAVGEKLILIVSKENKAYAELTESDFYPIGVTGMITEINQHGFAVIRTQYRVNVEDVRIYPDHTIKLMTSRRRDIEDLDAAVEQEKLKALIKEMRAYASGFEWSETAEYFIRQVDSVGMAACIMSPVLQISNEERYAILAEDSLAARAELIEKTLYEYMEVARITNEANSSQQEEYQQRYKEAAIKRQMEHLQKELDDMHPENVTDVQKFQQRIAESGMNETARKEAEKVLNRLRQEGKESVESGMLYDYLDFVTTLSWKKAEAERIDLEQARKILDEDHYGLKKVKDRIIQQIAVMNLKQQQSGSILLFVVRSAVSMCASASAVFMMNRISAAIAVPTSVLCPAALWMASTKAVCPILLWCSMRLTSSPHPSTAARPAHCWRCWTRSRITPLLTTT